MGSQTQIQEIQESKKVNLLRNKKHSSKVATLKTKISKKGEKSKQIHEMTITHCKRVEQESQAENSVTTRGKLEV